jgi:endoglucanase
MRMNDRRRLGIRRLVSVAALAVSAVLAVGAVAPLSAHAAADGWWHTSGSRIVAADGSTVTIKAANWFGLETPNCAPHGLWSITLDEGLAQIAAMGFNTVRLPYSNQCLAASTTSSIDASRNPDLVSLTPLQLMDAVIAKARARAARHPRPSPHRVVGPVRALVHLDLQREALDRRLGHAREPLPR